LAVLIKQTLHRLEVFGCERMKLVVRAVPGLEQNGKSLSKCDRRLIKQSHLHKEGCCSVENIPRFVGPESIAGLIEVSERQ
jgi:hypothetical protein